MLFIISALSFYFDFDTDSKNTSSLWIKIERVNRILKLLVMVHFMKGYKIVDCFVANETLKTLNSRTVPQKKKYYNYEV